MGEQDRQALLLAIFCMQIAQQHLRKGQLVQMDRYLLFQAGYRYGPARGDQSTSGKKFKDHSQPLTSLMISFWEQQRQGVRSSHLRTLPAGYQLPLSRQTRQTMQPI